MGFIFSIIFFIDFSSFNYILFSFVNHYFTLNLNAPLLSLVILRISEYTSRSLAEATGGLYGAGKFGYSINDKSTSTLVGATSAEATNPPTATKYATASANLADIDFAPALSASVAAGSIVKVLVNVAD